MLLTLALTSVSSVSCGRDAAPAAAPKKCDFQLATMTVISAPVINPTDMGEARPVVLRVYQLKEDIALQNAGFEKIWKDDKKSLGGTLISVDELTVYPGTQTEVKFERDPAALSVAAVALFRTPKGRSWFTTFELPAPPSKSQCGGICEGAGCDAGGPPPNPHFAVYVDGTRVVPGDDHLEDVADRARVRSVTLTPGSKGDAPPAAAASASGR